jgi:hypothetical protein
MKGVRRNMGRHQPACVSQSGHLPLTRSFSRISWNPGFESRPTKGHTRRTGGDGAGARPPEAGRDGHRPGSHSGEPRGRGPEPTRGGLVSVGGAEKWLSDSSVASAGDAGRRCRGLPPDDADKTNKASPTIAEGIPRRPRLDTVPFWALKDGTKGGHGGCSSFGTWLRER